MSIVIDSKFLTWSWVRKAFRKAAGNETPSVNIESVCYVEYISGKWRGVAYYSGYGEARVI
jgi:hypothetical protein